MIASVYWLVDAFPPRSPVMNFPSAMVCKMNVILAKSHDKQTSPYRERSLLDPIRVVIQVHVSEVERSIQNNRVRNTATNLNIMSDDNRRAVGLANPLPVEVNSCQSSVLRHIRQSHTSDIRSRTVYGLKN